MQLKQIVAWLVLIGALNWGLVGLLNLNVVEMILQPGSVLTKVVYIVIGLAGVYQLYILAGGKEVKM